METCLDLTKLKLKSLEWRVSNFVPKFILPADINLVQITRDQHTILQATIQTHSRRSFQISFVDENVFFVGASNQSEPIITANLDSSATFPSQVLTHFANIFPRMMRLCYGQFHTDLVEPFSSVLTHMLQHTGIRSLRLTMANNERFDPIASVLEDLHREQARSFELIIMRFGRFSPISESEKQLVSSMVDSSVIDHFADLRGDSVYSLSKDNGSTCQKGGNASRWNDWTSPCSHSQRKDQTKSCVNCYFSAIGS